MSRRANKESPQLSTSKSAQEHLRLKSQLLLSSYYRQHKLDCFITYQRAALLLAISRGRCCHVFESFKYFPWIKSVPTGHFSPKVLFKSTKTWHFYALGGGGGAIPLPTLSMTFLEPLSRNWNPFPWPNWSSYFFSLNKKTLGGGGHYNTIRHPRL